MSQVSEITNGATFSRSAEAGTIADQTTRVFRVISDAPGAAVDVQSACGVRIGDIHPQNQNIYCTSFNVTYDGESRMVLIVAFNYQATPGSSQSQGDQNASAPGIRPANFTTSTSLIETPVYKWRPRYDKTTWEPLTDAVNSAGDVYEGITQLTGLVNISITQEFVTDPTTHNMYTGYINDEEITLGTLKMAPHTVMFRGVQAQPYAESWGNTYFRGWRATYEFAYKRNESEVILNEEHPLFDVFKPFAVSRAVDLGWDIAVPQSGHNVRAFDPKDADPEQDIFGQPLLHGDAMATDPSADGLPPAAIMQKYAGVVIPPGDGGYYLPADINPGKRVPAMVKMFSYENGNKGCSQARASSPIPLNNDGTPRAETADPKVLVYAYQVQPSINFTNTFGLRLY